MRGPEPRPFSTFRLELSSAYGARLPVVRRLVTPAPRYSRGAGCRSAGPSPARRLKERGSTGDRACRQCRESGVAERSMTLAPAGAFTSLALPTAVIRPFRSPLL